MASKESRTYSIIQEKASSNTFIQALTGIVGFPFNLIGDGAVMFTHYAPMLNEIRATYGYQSISKEVLAPLLKGCSREILTDLIGDKFLGSIPVLGIYFNGICAKSLTWRLGILFGMLSARGEEINKENVKNCMRMIREVFPQRSMYVFKTPSAAVVENLLKAVGNVSENDFNKLVLNVIKGVTEANT